jgi:hypothetical protein
MSALPVLTPAPSDPQRGAFPCVRQGGPTPLIFERILLSAPRVFQDGPFHAACKCLFDRSLGVSRGNFWVGGGCGTDIAKA